MNTSTVKCPSCEVVGDIDLWGSFDAERHGKLCVVWRCQCARCGHEFLQREMRTRTTARIGFDPSLMKALGEMIARQKQRIAERPTLLDVIKPDPYEENMKIWLNTPFAYKPTDDDGNIVFPSLYP